MGLSSLCVVFNCTMNERDAFKMQVVPKQIVSLVSNVQQYKETAMVYEATLDRLLLETRYPQRRSKRGKQTDGGSRGSRGVGSSGEGVGATLARQNTHAHMKQRPSRAGTDMLRVLRLLHAELQDYSNEAVADVHPDTGTDDFEVAARKEAQDVARELKMMDVLFAIMQKPYLRAVRKMEEEMPNFVVDVHRKCIRTLTQCFIRNTESETYFARQKTLCRTALWMKHQKIHDALHLTDLTQPLVASAAMNLVSTVSIPSHADSNSSGLRAAIHKHLEMITDESAVGNVVAAALQQTESMDWITATVRQITGASLSTTPPPLLLPLLLLPLLLLPLLCLPLLFLPLLLLPLL
jgi:hypothetical protein